MALTKLLRNILDENLKIKSMSGETFGCLTKSLISQNFYRTMSDLSKTLILHPPFSHLTRCFKLTLTSFLMFLIELLRPKRLVSLAKW